ncbi:thiamine phosphate synthase [Nocardioides albus]|uniref:Thiamine-phosphate synthase n=1 Tax=Nocardioides albus TaxID=1841 RepID=A0A7W5A9P3_9ACTN|nr:thiamine phosphate synthase [Nocardioides albus]MBB3091970.1 thiamine-phosphate pyrophosphorylase [Nocardioides albus]
MPLPRIFCLVSSRDDLALLPAFAELGVAGFQVRDKAATTRELLGLSEAVIGQVGAYDACVVVDDRLDVALAAGAHGVHLGASDLPVDEARRIADAVAPGLIIGATCRDRAAVEAAAAEGADYAGFGPVFATSSKAGLPDPLGVDAVAAAAGALPLIAIGGISAAAARDVCAAGAHGVAVIGGLWRQPDPLQAAKELVEAVG